MCHNSHNRPRRRQTGVRSGILNRLDRRGFKYGRGGGVVVESKGGGGIIKPVAAAAAAASWGKGQPSRARPTLASRHVHTCDVLVARNRLGPGLPRGRAAPLLRALGEPRPINLDPRASHDDGALLHRKSHSHHAATQPTRAHRPCRRPSPWLHRPGLPPPLARRNRRRARPALLLLRSGGLSLR